MPKIPQFAPLLTFLFLLPAAVTFSQDKESDRTFRIAVSSLPPGSPTSLHYITGEATAEVPLNLYKISPPQPLDKDATVLPLYKTPPAPPAEADLPPAPDVTIPLPAAKKILIVLFPTVIDGTTTLGGHAIDEAAFPPGSIYFFNPTSLTLAAVLGEDKVQFAPGRAHLFTPPPIGAGKTFGVQIALHEEDGWRLFSSTRWHLAPTERHLLFFKINPRTKRADYDSLTDYFKPPE